MDRVSKPIEAGAGFNLTMQLDDPARLPELMGRLASRRTRLRIDAALRSLDYVHFARFLPLWDLGRLLIITEFDGRAADYVLDFAAVLDAEFSLILGYMKGRPRLPVSRYPDEFWRYVERNLRPVDPDYPPYAEPFSAYAGKSVLDVLGNGRLKKLPRRPTRVAAKLRLERVQANLLQGFRARRALHVGLRFPEAASGQAFLAALLAHPVLGVTPADRQPGADDHCVNIGLTFEGLQQLGVPDRALLRMPAAFREGPLARAASLGDTGQSAPAHWTVGRPEGGTASGVHAMVSLYVKGTVELAGLQAALSALSTAHRVAEVFSHVAGFENGGTTMHFGYRDGIAQPSIEGVHRASAGGQRSVPPGDFVLGSTFHNTRGGLFIGDIPSELADHATYAAVRVIEQDVEAFDALLARESQRLGISADALAAKLMGRWRDGSPLVQWPTAPDPGAADRSDDELDAFDFVRAGHAAPPNDPRGQVCPFGAHVRRLNPRSGMVVGVPWSRRVIRRGLPYTQAGKRGLFGIFFCGDLEAQFEFVQRVWANQDTSAFGLRGSTDVFIGARHGPTPFSFHVDGDPPVQHTVNVPPLTRTVGSLYLLMPGLPTLRWLSEACPAADPAPDPGPAPGALNGAASLDPHEPALRSDPYAVYARLRASSPIVTLAGSANRVRVLSHALVKEATLRSTEFLKPGHGRDPAPGAFGATARFDDGLFFMDPPRHTEVRSLLDPDMAAMREAVGPWARAAADALLAPARQAETLEWVGALASKLPTQVFMEAMGIPPADRPVLDLWTRAALASHNPGSPLDVRLKGGTATMAMHSYFLGLARGSPPSRTAWGSPTLMGALQKHAAQVAIGTTMNADEVMATGIHYALGGYLSTEFLLTTGVYNLLRHGQWARLRDQRGRMQDALWEMLRFDAPFQMADRWIAADTRLGGLTLAAGSMVTLVYGSANRDPFRDGSQDLSADRFDIGRPNRDSNFGFGAGPHRCIGSALAMAVAAAGLDALLDAFPNAKLGAPGDWSSDPYFRTLDKLTLQLR